MSERWRCSECGEKNIQERVNCYSCLAFKPGPQTPPGPVPRTPPDPPDQSNGVSGKKSWSCKFCSAINSTKTKECYLCNTVKQSKSPLEDQWVCKFCLTGNFLTEENCKTCNAVREASLPPSTPSISTPTPPSDPDVEYWPCSACSFKASHGPYCFQCGYPRNPSAKPCPDNWQCSKCQTTNFAKRDQCYSCNKKQRKRSPVTPVPTTCPTCKFCNQPSSTDCLLCGSALPAAAAPKPTAQKRRMLKTSSSSESTPITGSTSLPSSSRSQPRSSSSNSNHKSPSSCNKNIPKNLFITPKDWKCQSCDYKNIALRNFCKDCDTPRKCIAKLYIKYKKHGISAITNIVPTPDSTRSGSPSPQPLKSPAPRTAKSPVNLKLQSPGKLKSPGSGKSKTGLHGCSMCGRPHEGPQHVCYDCSVKLGSRGDQSVSVSSNSVMLKKCAQCGVECDGQYCNQCATDMGIRQERDTWECRKCHLVDENTAICMGCGFDKAESAATATKFLSCPHCKTKNHSHKTNCVRCLKALPNKEETPSAANKQSPATDTWTCKYCEIPVLAKSTHCRGCNRTKARAAKPGPDYSGSKVTNEKQEEVEEEEEEGEYVEGEEEEYPITNHNSDRQYEHMDDYHEENQEYFEEEYYEPARHFLPPPPHGLRFPPPGPPRLPPPGPHFSRPRYPSPRLHLQHRPRHIPPHPRLRLPMQRPRKSPLLPRRQPMNLMMQPNRGR